MSYKSYDITTMSHQQIFDTVCQHLAEQGGPALQYNSDTERTFCSYRGDDGKQCAAGIFIPKNEYSEWMEHGYPADWVFGDSGLNLILENETLQLLNALQNAHDSRESQEPLAEIRIKLDKVAQAFDLKPDAIKAITKWDDPRRKDA
jgi:hypothetical protein